MSERPMVGCRVPQEWKERLEELATETGRNISQVIFSAIEAYLEKSREHLLTHQMQDILRRLEELENKTVITELSNSIEQIQQKIAAIDVQLVEIKEALPKSTEPRKTALNSEHLAAILGVTERAVNAAAAKGKAHFEEWVKKFGRGRFTFEVSNPGSLKPSRRFFSL